MPEMTIDDISGGVSRLVMCIVVLIITYSTDNFLITIRNESHAQVVMAYKRVTIAQKVETFEHKKLVNLLGNSNNLNTG